jgi:hypothetical protein
MKKHILAAAVLACLPPAASAVSQNPDGTGQALIFPYYTVRSSGGNAFNTYVSVVNHEGTAKALRVRVRESRNSREVASFNLYLSPNDMWTAAVVPVGNDAARLITADRSCTSPLLESTAMQPRGITFSGSFYTGPFADGSGEGLDRTREGWIEMIEMSTLTGTTAARITHDSSGIPSNCAAVQGNTALDIAAPTGGLSGTLTLINVASGMDFTVNADALANLSTRSFFRPAEDLYPDFNAVEVEPVSIVSANGTVYRSTWNRGADAVSAALMRDEFFAEYVLDAGTRSRTELVMTFPTRQYYVAGATLSPPFFSGAPAGWSPDCNWPQQPLGTSLDWSYRNREEAGARIDGGDFPVPVGAGFAVCAAAAVLDVAHAPSTTGGTSITGSTSRGIRPFTIPANMENGWLSLFPRTTGLQSLASSTRMNVATGVVTAGAHVFRGLPVVGVHLRTFENGTLSCGAGACQGNYGGAFPLKYRRVITPSP